MAQYTSTTDTYLMADGIRESLADMIYDISPEETPFMSNVGRSSVRNTKFEWLTDALAAAATDNAQVEGDELGTVADATARVRLGNYTQISSKKIVVSNTQQAVDNAGIADEMAYQAAKLGRELKRDVETGLCGPQAANEGGETTARVSAGFEAFITTNAVRGTGGGDPVLTSGVPSAAPTDATTTYRVTFTEAMLKSALKQCWDSGGNPKMVIMGSYNKQKASGFTGIADIRKDVPGEQQATIIGAADIYVSDFGRVAFTPSRFCRTRSALVVDPEYAEVCYLRPFEINDIAPTGDAVKKLITVEYGLKLGTEKAHGVVADLTDADP